MSLLDGRLLVYGDVTQPIVLCVNETEERLMGVSFILRSGMVGQCSTLIAETSERFDDPIQLDIGVEESILGQFTVYAAANNNCSSNLRTDAFEILRKFFHSIL